MDDLKRALTPHQERLDGEAMLFAMGFDLTCIISRTKAAPEPDLTGSHLLEVFDTATQVQSQL